MTEQNNTPVTSGTREEVIQKIVQALIERRKMRGLTIEKVTQAIKIRKPYLESIEKGAWHELPGEVFVRGFVRRYAGFLGLDADKLIAPYIEAEEGAQAKTNDTKPFFEGNDIPPGIWIGLGVAVLLILGFIKLIRMDAKPKIEGGEASNVVVSTMAASIPMNAPTYKVESAGKADQHTIQIYVGSPLWIRVNAKDRSFEGFIGANSTWTWKAAGVFSVRLGRTMDVAITFDGAPVTLQPNVKRIELPYAN